MPFVTKPPKEYKVTAVNTLKDTLADCNFILLFDYQGLDVKTLTAIRNKLQTNGADLEVIKNTLFKLAVKDTPAQDVATDIAGATAMVYTSDDAVSAAKTVLEFAKGPKAVKVKTAVLDGVILDKKEVEELSKVPSKPELYAMVVGGLQSPITNLVGTMQSMISQLVMTLQAVSDQKTA